MSKCLCDKCSQIDLYGILAHGVPVEARIPLDSVVNVLSKSTTCSLCLIVLTAVRRTWLLDDYTQADLSGIDLALYSGGNRDLSYLDFAADSGSTPITIHVFYSYIPPEIETAVGPSHSRLPTIQLMAGDAHLFGRSQEGHGRVVEDTLDVSYIKQWLHACESTHGGRCTAPSWATDDELPSSVRMLDVVDMALVPAPPKCRYLSLSYVWGSAAECNHRSYCTNSANLARRSRRCGVELSTLPATISDAVLLARELDERYLWIDALCISQDDPIHKAEQISAMDRIYTRAILTVFAAGGSSANAPLPGFRSGTRVVQQVIEEVQDLHLVVPFPAALDELAQTTWDSRAWTYQEMMLSRRRLFFTPSQVIFECCTD
ncbi:HET-domain-containing protein, partial [Coniophora puteana RWD-64-598 SS2]